MTGAIFYATKYGSTAQYAKWISEATDLPMFDIKHSKADPSRYSFLVLGAPVIYYKLLNRKWVKKHLAKTEGKPVIFFTVSGAPAGPKLDGWIANCLPQSLISRMEHFVLGGRQNPKDLTLYDRMMLIIGSWLNPDRAASKEEKEGFDFMDKSRIEPIVKRIKQLQTGEVL